MTKTGELLNHQNIWCIFFFFLLPGFKFKGNFHGDKQQLLFKASGNQEFPKRFRTWKYLFLRLIWIRLIHSWQLPRRITFRTGSVAWQIKGFYILKRGILVILEWFRCLQLWLTWWDNLPDTCLLSESLIREVFSDAVAYLLLKILFHKAAATECFST